MSCNQQLPLEVANQRLNATLLEDCVAMAMPTAVMPDGTLRERESVSLQALKELATIAPAAAFIGDTHAVC